MYGLPGGGLAIPAAFHAGGGFSPLSQLYSSAFGGLNQYMHIGTPSDMDFDWDADSYSGMVWFKVTRTDVFQCILGKGYANTVHIPFFLGITDAGAPYLYLGGISTTGDDGTIIADTWYCAQWTATAGTGKLFINNVQQGADLPIGTEDADADWMLMATRYNDNTDDSFPAKGLANMVAIWNKSMSPTERTALYNAGVPVSPQNIPTNLTHWWSMGNDAADFGTSAFFIKDKIGSDNASLVHILSGGIWAETPTSVTPTFGRLTETGSDLHFIADDWSGSGNWAAAAGGWSGVFQNGGGASVKQETSQFTGIHEITTGDWFRLVDNNAHQVTSTSAFTYAFRMNPGALDGSGGFYLGNDGQGTIADFMAFNYFYAKDIGARLHSTDGTQYEISGLDTIHANQYITVHVVVDIANSFIRTYVNGTLVNELTTIGAPSDYPTAGAQAAPLGLLGVAYFVTGGYESTAGGQTWMEVSRYTSALTSRQIATTTAAWNVLKGYI